MLEQVPLPALPRRQSWIRIAKSRCQKGTFKASLWRKQRACAADRGKPYKNQQKYLTATRSQESTGPVANTRYINLDLHPKGP
eukprot:s483_g5.t1